jgi:ABC-type spermidine/putrescine transport system permease subunit II
MGKKNAASPAGLRKSANLKNISSCLLAVACLVCLYLPMSVYIALSITEESASTNLKISWLWTKTIITTNSTFNCLIFFWKNNILRTEGIRVIKVLKSVVVCPTCRH